MTESEIIENVFKIFDRYWSMIQWWASVSFGLIAVAHFAVDKLSRVLVALLILLYMLFTAWVVDFYFFNVQILAGFRQDLSQLGDTAHFGTRSLLDSSIVKGGLVLQDIAFVMTFVGAVGYLIYTFVRHERSKQVNDSKSHQQNPD